jgi:hypothetical protein
MKVLAILPLWSYCTKALTSENFAEKMGNF